MSASMTTSGLLRVDALRVAVPNPRTIGEALPVIGHRDLDSTVGQGDAADHARVADIARPPAPPTGLTEGMSRRGPVASSRNLSTARGRS